MHPLVAYDLAKLRIEESHRLAERERLVRATDDPSAAPSPAGIRFGTRARRPSLLARLAGALAVGMFR